MSGMYKQFGTNKNLERTGVAIDYGPFRVTIARAGGSNKDFDKLIEAKTKPFRRAIQTNTIEREKVISIAREAFAQTCIKNWETKVDGEWKVGIEAPDGSLLPMTYENILKTLEALPDLFTDLQEQAASVALFQQGEREEDAKN